MKRFLFFMTLLIAFCVPRTLAQALFYEGFESTSGSSLPTGWTNEGNKTWTTATGVNGSYPSSAYAGSRNAQIYPGAYSTTTKLITPAIDCSGKPTVILTFAYVNQSWSGDIDALTIYYRTSTADSWHQIENITSDHYSWTLSEEYTISTSSSATFQLAFECNSNYGRGFGIDEVTLMPGPSCIAPANLTVSDITRTSFRVNWKSNASSEGYQVLCSTNNVFDEITETPISVPSTTNYLDIDNLERNTQYYIFVRSVCGAENGNSDWVQTSAKTKALNDCSYSLTVADGTSTSAYIPVYGNYCDDAQKSQSIYPESMLTGLVGKTISKLKYYVSSGSSANWQNATFNVRMMETSASTVPSFINTADATLVYSGTLRATIADGMEITLNTPFTYTGGNLLIEFELPTETGYTSCYFYGISATDASRYEYGIYNSGGTLNFLPKVDFGYCESMDACPAVTNVTVSDIAQTTANLSWTASTGDYANTYDVLVSTTPVTDFSDVVPNYSGLTSCSQELALTPYTDYYVYVRVNCDARNHDDGKAWSEAAQFKTLSNCVVPTDLTVIPLTKTSAKAQWTATSQASNYRYILSTAELENPDEEQVTASGIQSNNTLLNRLTPGETYYLYLSNVCGGQDGNSPYIFTTFTMPEACIAPTEMNITDIQKYQMTLNWTPSQFTDDDDAFDIYVSDAEILDFTGIVPTYTAVTGSSKVIDLLQRNTTYYIYMRSNCGEGAVTDWSTAVSGTTLDAVLVDCNNIQTVAIGNGSDELYNVPNYAYFNYSLSEQIYTANEIGRAGTINSLSFFCIKNGGYSRNVSVYLAHTSKSAFSSSTDWVTVTTSDLVYSGSYQITSNAWNTINFTTPFEYNGTDNLLVVFDDNSGNYQYSYAYFQSHIASGNSTIYYANDNTNLNPTSSITTPSTATYNATFNNRNDIQFGFCSITPLCPALDAPVATDVTNTEATISWNAGTGDFATSYDLVISETPVTDFTGVTLAADDVTDTFFTANNLSANTHYYAYVLVNCVNDIYNDGSSLWSPAGEFTTELPCLKPENFVAGSPLSDRVELSWIKKGTATDWIIYADTFDVESNAWLPNDTVFVNATDCDVVVDTVTYLLTGLQADKRYTLAILTNCGETDGFSKFATNTPSFATLSNVTGIDTMVINNTETIAYAIDRTANTVNITVRKGADLTNIGFNLILADSRCTFNLNGENASNTFDFSEPVSARVFAQDINVYSDWTITIVEEDCATPFNMEATDIDRRTANLNWNIGDASTSFNLVINETALDDPATGTVQNITVTNEDGACTYAITELTRETHYYVYVRTNCGSTFSQWRGIDFTTKSLVDCSTVGGTEIICDGTITDSHIPYYGYNYDGSFDQSQFIYSDDLMTSLRGKSIKKMTFFTTTSSKAHNGNIEVRIGLTSADNLSAGYENAPKQIVYTGVLTVSNYMWEINFGDNSFSYPKEGGNLLIQVKKTMNGSYGSDYFYGTTDNATAVSRMTDGSNQTTYSFLPKVQFDYCSTSDACPEVTNVAVSDIAETSATVTWTESTGDYANTSDIYYSTTEVDDFTGVEPQVTNITGNSAQITGLANYTIYYVYVRTHCDAEGQDDGISNWAGGTSFRTLSSCRVPGTPVATVTGKHTTTVVWTNTSEGSQADNFTYIVSATPVAEADLESATPTASAFNNTTADLSGLICETTYHFYVKNVCTGDVNCSSPWDSCQFTMPLALPAVINLQTHDIASNAFTATWESDTENFADETAWEVACVAYGETPTSWTAVSEPEYFAFGLTPETHYDFYVRVNDGESYSANAVADVTTTALPEECLTIGESTASYSYGPVCGYYGYERNIYLFTPEDGLSEGTIESISWQYSNANKTIPAKIYLKNTTLTDLSSLYNNTFNNAIDGATLVYDAILTAPSNWVDIDITDFEYTGGNLMVLVASNYGGSGGATTYAYYTNSTQSSTHIASRKDNSYDDETQVMSDASSKELNKARNNIKFCFTPSSCRPVTNLVVDNITATSARAHWYPGAAETEWHVYNSTEQMSSENLALLTAADYTTSVNPQIALSNLTKDMDYYIYVRGVCNEEESSKWEEYHYTTLPSCSAPATAVATSDADNSITFTVTSGEYGTEGTYDYRYWIVGTTDTVTVAGQTSELIVNNLAAGVDYAWMVRANCSGVDEGASRWVTGNTIHVCGEFAIPFSDNFESYEASTIPGCWTVTATQSSYPYLTAADTYNGVTSKAIKFAGSAAIATPKINVPEGGIKISFKLNKEGSSSGSMKVMLVSDLPGGPSYTIYGYEFVDCGTSNKTLLDKSVFIHTHATTGYVVFQQSSTTTSWYYWLDDLHIDAIPHYNVATSVAPAIGSVEVAFNEGDTLSSGVFYEGATPVFTAVPNEGIEFINWTNANNGDVLSVDNPLTISIAQDTAIVANFDTASFNLNVMVAPGQDIYGEVAGSGNYLYGRTVNYSASPMAHYSVVWNDGNTGNNRSIVIPAHDTTIVATFALDKHQLSVAMNDSSKGSVTGTGVYDYGTFVEISATPLNDHVIFNGWSNGETANTITIDLQNDSTVTALFAWDEHTVSTGVNDMSMGSVSGAGTYTHNDYAHLVATPADHHIFVEWSNGETNDTIDVQVVSDTAIYATFDWDSHDITVLRNVDSMGTVTGADNYYHGTTVTLTATPADHHHFVDWSTGETTTSITVTADEDKTITANFAIDQHVITAISNDSVRGTVTGGGVYNYGDTATLIAESIFPYQFSRWDDEDLTEENIFKVKVLGDATYTAYFKFDEFDVITRSDDQTMGTVTGGGSFVYDTIVNVTATANEHYHFVRWNNGSIDPTTTVIVRNDTVLTAYFAIDQHVVSADVNNIDLGTVAGAGTYNYGDEATLTATPAAHGVFAGWSNGETANPLTITVAGDTIITAIFTADTHTIAATADETMGNVTGAGEYVHGTMATLTAIANEHYHFVNWSNGVAVNSFSILVDKDSAVTANFAINQHVVRTDVNNIDLGTVAGAGTYNYGDEATLTATPAIHGVFAGWSNGETANPLTITVAGDTAVTAMFSADTHTIAAVADETMGSVTGTGEYVHGTMATLTATANEHYHFVNWSNGVAVNTFSILVDKDSTVTANFTTNQYVVTANSNDINLGSVTGAGTYNYGDAVTLTATPAVHGVFAGWSNGETANPLTIALAGDTTITAIFTVDSHIISANVNDAAMGYVEGTGEYVHGTAATLTAVANSHYHFVDWSTGETSDVLTILVDNDSTVTANFAVNQHAVTANVNDINLGTITGAGTYNYGAVATLTATPAAHGVFAGWSNGETANPLAITVAGDTTITAVFTVDTHIIAANADATMGNVAGAGTYTHGTMATLTATANAHYHFVNWSNGSTQNPLTITVDKDSTLTAYFAIDQHTVTVISDDVNLGSVTGSGVYDYGTPVAISATPTVYYSSFAGWSNGIMTPAATINLTSDTTIVAFFELNDYTVTLNTNNDDMGSVSGAGVYTYGNIATITATPAFCHHFVNWSDGDTHITRAITVVDDLTLTANFAIDEYTVSVSVNNAAAGRAYCNNGGAEAASMNVDCGTVVEIHAEAETYYHFVEWSDGIEDVIRNIDVTSDTDLVAIFEPNCGDGAELPVVFLYNDLLMVDLDSLKARNYDPKPTDVTWYQVVDDVDMLEDDIFPLDDKALCTGYYLSLPTCNVGYGQYYAVVNVGNSKGLCKGLMKTVVTEYVNANSKPHVEMAPTSVKNGDYMTITGLVADETTVITVCDYTGKTIETMQTEGAVSYDFKACGTAGVYIVKVTSESVNETLRFVVTK